ncbi:hypothetical protein [Actinopolymorpha sp. B9G3]|uniref:HAAS signaling domain-containing protein n=2 Tax=unclassified Actinopolymorpha TaxID=2627063 RepID=UPI0032D95313
MNDAATVFDDYLRRLEGAAQKLPASRREELLSQIREHLDEVKTTLAPNDDRRAREAVERLGDPEHIVLEAMDSGAPADGARPVAADEGPPPANTRTPVFEMIAVILLLGGGFLLGVGWIAGAVMTWVSTRWSVLDKLLGSLVWPGGLAAVWFSMSITTKTCTEYIDTDFDEAGKPQTTETLTRSCSGFALPEWLGTPLLVILLLAPIAVALYLLRRAARQSPLKNPHGR